jgi:hypothetical protein
MQRAIVACVAMTLLGVQPASAEQPGKPGFWADYAKEVVDPLTWRNDRGDMLKLSGQAGLAAFFNRNTTFGRNKENFGRSSDHFQELTGLVGLNGDYGLGGGAEFGRLYGGLSGSAAWTTATEPGEGNYEYSDAAWETAFLGWRSGTVFDALGPDAVDLSAGRQNYQVGSGFLFWNGATNGGGRAGAWTGIRTAWKETAVAKFATHGVTARVAYLRPDDNPDTDTRFVNTDLTYDLSALGDVGDVGAGYSHFFDSDIETRDGMDVWNLRANLTPLKPTGYLTGLTLLGEYAHQDNGNKLESDAWFAEVGYDFAGVLPWSPYLSYRYASFEGGGSADGKSRTWDPLFYGMGGSGNQSWGTWFQGEVLGEWVIGNSNLNSSNVRLVLNPSDDLQIYLLYYYFTVDNQAAAGVTDSSFAHEVDLIGSYSLNKYLSFTGVLGWSKPETAAEETFDGANDDWLYSMIYTQITF